MNPATILRTISIFSEKRIEHSIGREGYRKKLIAQGLSDFAAMRMLDKFLHGMFFRRWDLLRFALRMEYILLTHRCLKARK